MIIHLSISLWRNSRTTKKSINPKKIIKQASKNTIKKVIEKKVNSMWQEEYNITKYINIPIFHIDVYLAYIGNKSECIDKIANYIDETIEKS